MSSTKHASLVPNERVVGDGHDDLAALKADLETLRNDVKSLINTTKDLAQTKSQTGVVKGKEALNEAADSITEMQDLAQDTVKKNPLAAVGVAFGLGAVLAMLRTK